MEFKFESKLTARDMWKLSMNHIYHSMLGVYNLIFAVAIILLTVKFWNDLGDFLKGFLVLVCILFPVMQPILIYFRASKQIAALPKDMVIGIDDTGLHITADGKKSHMPWSRVKGTIVERNMVILAIDGGRGYMLTNKVLGTQKEELLKFVETKVKNNKKE